MGKKTKAKLKQIFLFLNDKRNCEELCKKEQLNIK